MLLNIAISLLWMLIGIVVLGLVVYLLLRVLSLWFTIDGRIVQAVWLIFAILCLIAILTALGGGGTARPFWKLGELGGSPAAISFQAA